MFSWQGPLIHEMKKVRRYSETRTVTIVARLEIWLFDSFLIKLSYIAV